MSIYVWTPENTDFLWEGVENESIYALLTVTQQTVDVLGPIPSILTYTIDIPLPPQVIISVVGTQLKIEGPNCNGINPAAVSYLEDDLKSVNSYVGLQTVPDTNGEIISYKPEAVSFHIRNLYVTCKSVNGQDVESMNYQLKIYSNFTTGAESLRVMVQKRNKPNTNF